jgi:hypothetical protein
LKSRALWDIDDVNDDPSHRPGTGPDEERERLHQLGALAQSYAPRGLARVLNLTPEGRARARAAWSAQSRLERMAFFAVLATQFACMGVIVWGVATRDGTIVLAGAAAIVLLMLGTAAVQILVEVRRANLRRQARQVRDDRFPGSRREL